MSWKNYDGPRFFAIHFLLYIFCNETTIWTKHAQNPDMEDPTRTSRDSKTGRLRLDFRCLLSGSHESWTGLTKMPSRAYLAVVTTPLILAKPIIAAIRHGHVPPCPPRLPEGMQCSTRYSIYGYTFKKVLWEIFLESQSIPRTQVIQWIQLAASGLVLVLKFCVPVSKTWADLLFTAAQIKHSSTCFAPSSYQGHRGDFL